MLSEEGGVGSGCWVLADEIYERITYDTKHVAFATLPGMFERTMTVSPPVLFPLLPSLPAVFFSCCLLALGAGGDDEACCSMFGRMVSHG